MTKENIYGIRIEWIIKIKEKIKKNPKYIHPCNRERQEDMEILQFSNGYDFTFWMQQNGILSSSARTRDKYFQDKGFKNRQDYEDKCSRDLGFKDSSERKRNGCAIQEEIFQRNSIKIVLHGLEILYVKIM